MNNEEHYNLYTSPNIKMRMRLAGYVAHER
jgi:hypothetical protein